MATLHILIDLIFGKIKEVHDNIQIVFSDCTILSILNNYGYDDGSVLSIKDKKVISVEESGNSVIIFFESGKSLPIGLDDGDYSGPEVMVLKMEEKFLIIWN